MTRRFVVVGESLVDVVVPTAGASSREPGGSPLNVAVGLARLDVPTLLITRVGDDPDGRLVAEHARASEVQLAAGSVVPTVATSTATAVLDEDHVADYTFELAWDLPPQRLPAQSTGLHVGSLGAWLGPGRAAVHDLVRQAGAAGLPVSYDPNVRPAFLDDPGRGWREVLDLAGQARLVKVSQDDLRLLRPEASADDLAKRLLAGERTELVVVTHGGAGATGYCDRGRVSVPGCPVEVVDTVGAGDSFMAALIALLLQLAPRRGGLRALGEDRLAALLRAAGVAAAITCSRRGADPPRRAELPAGWPD